jgi:hypothetical protein
MPIASRRALRRYEYCRHQADRGKVNDFFKRTLCMFSLIPLYIVP